MRFKSIIFLAAFCYSAHWIVAQSTDKYQYVQNFSNRGQQYAILSAQHARDAHFFQKKSIFSSSLKEIREGADRSVSSLEAAISYADSALTVVSDTNIFAIEYMNASKKFAEQSIKYIRSVHQTNKASIIRARGKKAVLYAGNAITDAYHASLYMNEGQEKKERVKPGDNRDQEKYEASRTEADHASFVSLAKLYQERLKELDEELSTLEGQYQQANNPAEKEKLQQVIEGYEKEKASLSEKLGKSEEKMTKIKNEIHVESWLPMNIDLPEGLIYRVQVGYYSTRKQIEEVLKLMPMPELDPLSGEVVSGQITKYYAGAFRTYEEANVSRNFVKKQGIEGAFVVAFHNGKKISISEALKIEKNN